MRRPIYIHNPQQRGREDRMEPETYLLIFMAVWATGVAFGEGIGELADILLKIIRGR